MKDGIKKSLDLPDVAIKEFKNCKNLIIKNNFEAVNNHFRSVFGPNLSCGRLFDFFCACDVHPLRYMNEIPKGFFRGTYQDEIYVPKNIKKISKDAFGYTHNIIKLTLPKELYPDLPPDILEREKNGNLKIVQY